MNKKFVNLAKWTTLSLGTVLVFFSIIVIVSASGPSAWAQCGADSYTDACTGGVRCTSIDNVGCKCYDANGRVVSSHRCRAIDL
jgi:hypothetical protein